MGKRTAIVVAMVIIVLALVVGGWAYNHSRNQTKNAGSTGTTSQNNASGNQNNSSGSGNQNKNYTVSVYFSKHPESDNDPSLTFPVHRTTTTSGVAKFSISELLKGPTATESARGYFSTTRLRDTASTCGGADFTLNITNGTATLQFCKNFDHLGVVADGQADSEIKATLKQFSTVQKVVILNSAGDCEFNLSGQNLCKQKGRDM